MSRFLVDIKGEIEGDYSIVCNMDELIRAIQCIPSTLDENGQRYVRRVRVIDLLQTINGRNQHE